MSQWEVGTTAPPFHVWCRSTTVPAFEDEFDHVGERAARGEDGKTYYIPADMTYREWEKSFVGGEKSGLKEMKTDGKINGMKIQDVTDVYLDNALPGKGTLTYAAGYKTGTHQNEIQMAEWIHNTFGGDITLLAESDVRNVKMPDYKWGNKLWELKGATSINGADKSLQKAIKQIREKPGGVVLNLLEVMDRMAFEKQICSRVRRSQIEELDIIVLLKGKLVKVLRYKK